MMLDKQDQMLDKQDTTISILKNIKEDTSEIGAIKEEVSTARYEARREREEIISALKSGRISMGIVELFSVTVVVFAFIHMRKTHQYFVAGMISTLMMFILFFVLFVSGAVANTGHVWTFSLPLFLLFIFGIKWGSLVAALFLVSVITTLYMPSSWFHRYHYTWDFLASHPIPKGHN